MDYQIAGDQDKWGLYLPQSSDLMILRGHTQTNEVIHEALSIHISAARPQLSPEDLKHFSNKIHVMYLVSKIAANIGSLGHYDQVALTWNDKSFAFSLAGALMPFEDVDEERYKAKRNYVQILMERRWNKNVILAGIRNMDETEEHLKFSVKNSEDYAVAIQELDSRDLGYITPVLRQLEFDARIVARGLSNKSSRSKLSYIDYTTE